MSALDTPRAADPLALPPMSGAEFVGLAALAVSLVALSIDAMLPALDAIAAELRLADPNARQSIVTAFVLGLALGPIPFGLVSDAIGRRRAIAIGLAFFAAGSVVGAAAQDLDTLLAGRFIAGFGAAGPRTLAVAVVRDRFEGRAMARVMSFVMTVFILVPALAPALGLGVEVLGGWRAIFALFVGIAAVLAVWGALRLPETLPPERRRPVRLDIVRAGVAAAASDRRVIGPTLACGCAFGGFLAYLASAQQVLGETYGLGDGFVLAFGALALAFAAASLVNARLVMRLGMARIASAAVLALFALGTSMSALAPLWDGRPPLALFLPWCAATFFVTGLSFVNLTTLAMQPLGAFAGLGSALVTTLSTLVAVPIAAAIAGRYDGRPDVLAHGFALAALGAGLLLLWSAGAARETRS